MRKLYLFLALNILFCFCFSFLGLQKQTFFLTKSTTTQINFVSHNTTYSTLVNLTTQQVVLESKNTLILETYATESDIKKELEKTIGDQIGFLDLTEMQKVIDALDEQGKSIFVSGNIADKLLKIITGDFKILGDNAFGAFVNLFFDSFIALVPLMASIIAVGVLSGMLNQVRSSSNGKSLGDIIHFVCFGLVLVLVISSVYKLLEQTGTTLNFIKTQIDAIFPILLTMLTAIGGNVSVSVYQPAIGLLSGSILQIFNFVLVPIFIFSFVFSIISNFSSAVKLDKFGSFLSSLFKWIVGTVFTVFIAFVSIQGITAGSIDGVSIKTAKFAMKSYIPIVGGYLADGFNVIMASSVLIKNAIGICGLLIIFSSVIVPILNIVVFELFLKLTAAILEPITDGKISNFLFGVSKSISMLTVILIGISFMFLILTALIMGTANFM